MHIPQLDLSEAQGKINVGPKAGSWRYYRDALFSTLVELKPKYCLEIGTHTGLSAEQFQRYFNNYMPDGHLWTCDIKSYRDLHFFPNVTFVQVHSHLPVDDVHAVEDNELLAQREGFTYANAWCYNLDLINEAIGDECVALDFAFIDGDHRGFSALHDLYIASELLTSKGYILLDDVDEWEHDVAKLYHENIKLEWNYDFYEYDDWTCPVGMALMRRKE